MRKPARKAAKPARKVTRKAVPKPVRKASKKAPARKPVKKAAVRQTPARKPAPKAPVRKAAEAPRKAPNLERARKRLAEAEEPVSVPSSLGYEGAASGARTGRSELREALAQHTETGPALTGGDIDGDWEDAYAVGDQAPGGDNPTPDQNRVEDIGKALGVEYNDNEELKGAEKIHDRDRNRWELDPASSDDYVDRQRDDD